MRNPVRVVARKIQSGSPDFDRFSGGIITIESYNPYLNHELGQGQDRQWVAGHLGGNLRGKGARWAMGELLSLVIWSKR